MLRDLATEENLFFVRDDHRFALSSHQDFVLSQLEICLGNNFLVIARSIQRRFIDEVSEVSSGESRSAARDDADVDVFTERNLARVNFQDAFASTNVWTRDHDTTIESTGPKQCRIENIRPVRRSDQNYAIVRFEAIHFDE